MASQFERGENRRPVFNSEQTKPLNFGLRGEELVFLRPAIKHTNGAKEARKAQQM